MKTYSKPRGSSHMCRDDCLVTGEGDDKYLVATAEQLLCVYHEMIKNSEEFYQMLNLPYHVVSIVSGALNDAAAKKYDLEGWYPASQTYRVLVSCSNCTDYQSRKLEIRFGQKKSFEQTKQYIHLLNSTPTATERTMCCVLDNCQKEDGVEVLAWAEWPSNLSRTNWRLKSKGRNQRPKVIIF